MLLIPCFIRCLAHVINFAAQALISTYSSANHFDPSAQHDYNPDDVDGDERDEVGLIWATTVEVSFFFSLLVLLYLEDIYLSAKRKELLKSLQTKGGKDVLMLLLDMKVCWSSTYIMLQ